MFPPPPLSSSVSAFLLLLLLPLLLWCPRPSSCFDLTVLHTNDLHSRFDEVTSRGSACKSSDRARGRCFGGVARVKGAADRAREEAEGAAILVNAGDFFQVSKVLVSTDSSELES